MMKIIVNVLVLLWTVMSEEVKRCPQNEGIFANPDDCQTFILCNNYVPQLKKCPNGLYFNPTLKVCDFPEQSRCKSGKKLDNYECGGGERLYQDPMDCHSFYMCSSGRSHRFECPAGLIFYPQINRCDYPESSGFLCFNSENKFPNTSDCRMYLDCSKSISGYACPRQCPPRLQFNRYLEECVIPEKSWCSDQSNDELNHSLDGTDDINADPLEPISPFPDPSDPQDANDSDYYIDPSLKFNDYIEVLFPPNLIPFPESDENVV